VTDTWFHLPHYAGSYVIAHATGIKEPQKQAYLQLLKAINFLWWKSFHSKDIILAGQRLVTEAVAGVEAFLPASELDIKNHMIYHLPQQILRVGPLNTHSMFPYENLNGIIGRLINNLRDPEANATRMYALMELAVLTKAADDDSDSGSDDDDASETRLWLPDPDPGSSYNTKRVVYIGSSREGRVVAMKPRDMYNAHRFYLLSDDSYRELFNLYCDQLEENGKLQQKGLSWHMANGSYWCDEKRFSSVVLPEWQYWKPEGEAGSTLDDKQKLICQGFKLQVQATQHKALKVQGVEFRAHAPNMPYYKWFLAVTLSDSTSNLNLPSNDGTIPSFYACQIQKIIEYQPPWHAGVPAADNAQNDIIVEAAWYLSDPKEPFDPITCMPVVSSKPLTDAQIRVDGPWWSATQIAPVRLVALPHWKEKWATTKTLLMHRDPRFVWTAGIPLSDDALVASILKP
jgi:hypothetical protein